MEGKQGLALEKIWVAAVNMADLFHVPWLYPLTKGFGFQMDIIAANREAGHYIFSCKLNNTTPSLWISTDVNPC
jgi:hypothetical protein